MEDSGQPDDLVTVFASGNPTDVAAVKSALDDAGIPFATKGEGVQSVFGSGPFLIEVQVSNPNESTARDLIADIWTAPPLTDDTEVPEETEDFAPIPVSTPALSDSQRGCLGFFVAVLFVLISSGLYQITRNPSAASITRHAKDLTEQGRTLLHQKDYAAATNVLTRAIQTDRDNSAAYGLRGLSEMNLKQYENALEDYTYFIALRPEDDWAFEARASVSIAQSNYDKALQDIQQAIQLNPHEPRYYRQRGNIYLARKQFKEALDDADHAIAMDPNSALNYALRGRVYFELKDFQKAILNFNEVTLREPKNSIAYYNRSLSYAALERIDEATKDAEKSVELDPQNTKHLTHRAWLYHQNSQFDKAINDCEQALKLEPHNAHANYAFAAILVDANETTRAMDLVKHALQIESTSTTAANCHALLAWMGYLSADYEKARRECDLAVKLDPDCVNAHITAAQALARLGKVADADTESSHTMSANPESSYAYAYRGEVRRLEGNPDGALADLNEAIKRNSRAEYFGYRALAYLSRGNPENAARDFEKCYGLNKYLKPRFEKWAAEVRTKKRG